MITLVPDMSVCIDLEQTGLFEPMLSCGLAIAVPDLLRDRMLTQGDGRHRQSSGLLQIIALTPAELGAVQRLRARRSALSLPDCLALICAARPDHLVVTDDRILREEAAARSITAHGLLWLFDRMAESGSVPVAMLWKALSRIADPPRCRLPKGEIRKWLARADGISMSRANGIGSAGDSSSKGRAKRRG